MHSKPNLPNFRVIRQTNEFVWTMDGLTGVGGQQEKREANN